MPDIYTENETLQINNFFADADTRTISLKNPKNDLTRESIENLSTFMQENQIILGDKTNAAFVKITKATKKTKNTTYLDID